MAYILDGVVILVFLLAIWMGYRRGFFKSFVQLIGCIAAAFIAFTFSAPLATGIYDQFIANSVQQKIAVQIQQTDSQSVQNALENVLDELPDPITNALNIFDLGTPEKVTAKISDSINNSAEVVTQHVEEQVVRPVAIKLLRMLCFSILFVVTMILVSIAASLIGNIFRLPVLRQVNGLLGAVLGAVRGVILVFVAVTVMTLIADASGGNGKLTPTTINNTTIVHAIDTVNPIAMMNLVLKGNAA